MEYWNVGEHLGKTIKGPPEPHFSNTPTVIALDTQHFRGRIRQGLLVDYRSNIRLTKIFTFEK